WGTARKRTPKAHLWTRSGHASIRWARTRPQPLLHGHGGGQFEGTLHFAGRRHTERRSRREPPRPDTNLPRWLAHTSEALRHSLRTDFRRMESAGGSTSAHRSAAMARRFRPVCSALHRGPGRSARAIPTWGGVAPLPDDRQERRDSP